MPEETEYGYGALVTVSATPAEGWRFLQWQSGTEVMSLSPSYRFAITEHTQLTAVFEEDPAAHPLRVHVLGRGRVDRGAGNADSATAYAHGTTVDLQAVPEEGSVFDHWEGDVVPEAQQPADASAYMDSPKVAIAVFAPSIDIDVDLNDDGDYFNDEEREPPVVSGEESALTEVQARGEFVRCYDQIDNGIGSPGNAVRSHEPNSLARYIPNCDDLQLIKISTQHSWPPDGRITLRVVPVSAGGELHEDDVLFFQSQAIDLDGSGSPYDFLEFPLPLRDVEILPNGIYMLVKPYGTTQARFDVIVEVESDLPGVPIQRDRLRFTAVPGPGAPNYFDAALDYMAETGSKLFVDRKRYPRRGLVLEQDVRFVVLPQSRTSMYALNAYGHNPKLGGIDAVVGAFGDYTVITHGGQVADRIETDPGTGKAWSVQTRGLLVHNGSVDNAVSIYESTLDYDEQFVKRENENEPILHSFIAYRSPAEDYYEGGEVKKANAKFFFKRSFMETVLESTNPPSIDEATGGMYGPRKEDVEPVDSNLSPYKDHWDKNSEGAWGFIAEAPGIQDDGLVIAFADYAGFFSNDKVILHAGRAGAGKDVFRSGATHLLFLDAHHGSALAYAGAGGAGPLSVRLKGMLRHNPKFAGRTIFGYGGEHTYYIPTYLMFKVE